MSAELQISLPNWPMARLLKEACANWNLRHPSDPPADPEESDWRLLYNAVIGFLRHQHTLYEQALAQGADRDELREKIHAAACRQFAWLRIEHDPRVDAAAPIEPDRKDTRPFNDFSKRLSDLVTERSRLTVAISLARRKRTSGWREQVAELEHKLARVNERVEALNGLFNTGIEKHANGVFVNSMGHPHLVPGYDFGGRGMLPESYTKSTGFRCPVCQKLVLRSKSPIDHGADKRLVAFSCWCLSLSLEGNAAFTINLKRWQQSVAKHDQSTNILIADSDGLLYGFELARQIKAGHKQAADARIFRDVDFNAFVALLMVKHPEHEAVQAILEAETVTPAMLERISAEIVLTAGDIETMLESQERFLAENA